MNCASPRDMYKTKEVPDGAVDSAVARTVTADAAEYSKLVSA